MKFVLTSTIINMIICKVVLPEENKFEYGISKNVNQNKNFYFLKYKKKYEKIKDINNRKTTI